MKNVLILTIITKLLVMINAQDDWAVPSDTSDFPNLDIGYYPVQLG